MLAAATLFVGWARSGLEVRVDDSRTGRTVWRQAVVPGERVELHYRHSVERTPVVEVFRVEPDGLWFVEMQFVSQGAGLPTEGYVREGDHFVLRRPRRIGTLPLLVSRVAGHRLAVAGRRVDMVAAAGDGSHVGLTAGRPRLLRWPGK